MRETREQGSNVRSWKTLKKGKAEAICCCALFAAWREEFDGKNVISMAQGGCDDGIRGQERTQRNRRGESSLASLPFFFSSPPGRLTPLVALFLSQRPSVLHGLTGREFLAYGMRGARKSNLAKVASSVHVRARARALSQFRISNWHPASPALWSDKSAVCRREPAARMFCAGHYEGRSMVRLFPRPDSLTGMHF